MDILIVVFVGMVITTVTGFFGGFYLGWGMGKSLGLGRGDEEGYRRGRDSISPRDAALILQRRKNVKGN